MINKNTIQKEVISAKQNLKDLLANRENAKNEQSVNKNIKKLKIHFFYQKRHHYLIPVLTLLTQVSMKKNKKT